MRHIFDSVNCATVSCLNTAGYKSIGVFKQCELHWRGGWASLSMRLFYAFKPTAYYVLLYYFHSGDVLIGSMCNRGWSRVGLHPWLHSAMSSSSIAWAGGLASRYHFPPYLGAQFHAHHIYKERRILYYLPIPTTFTTSTTLSLPVILPCYDL